MASPLGANGRFAAAGTIDADFASARMLKTWVAGRIEYVSGINDAGVIVGFMQDAIPDAEGEANSRANYGVTLRPLPAQPGVSFADSTFDHVND